MVSRIVMVCVGALLLSSNAIAQDPATAPATRGDLETFAARIEGKVAQWQQVNESRLTALEEKVRALSDIQESGRQAIEQIAKKDDEGKSYLRIDTSHEPTRTEFRRAMSESMPVSGTITIENQMAYDQIVSINGKTIEVMAGDSRDVTVPLGTFRVRLPGTEGEVRYVGLPTYTARVVVRPRTTAPQPISAPMYWNYVYQ